MIAEGGCNQRVVGVGDPDASGRLISVQERPRATNINDEVILDQVLSLGSILNEDRVAHSVISNVVLYTQIVNTMDGHSSVESVMDGVVTNVR